MPSGSVVGAYSWPTLSLTHPPFTLHSTLGRSGRVLARCFVKLSMRFSTFSSSLSSWISGAFIVVVDEPPGLLDIALASLAGPCWMVCQEMNELLLFRVIALRRLCVHCLSIHVSLRCLGGQRRELEVWRSEHNAISAGARACLMDWRRVGQYQMKRVHKCTWNTSAA